MNCLSYQKINKFDRLFSEILANISAPTYVGHPVFTTPGVYIFAAHTANQNQRQTRRGLTLSRKEATKLRAPRLPSGNSPPSLSQQLQLKRKYEKAIDKLSTRKEQLKFLIF